MKYYKEEYRWRDQFLMVVIGLLIVGIVYRTVENFRTGADNQWHYWLAFGLIIGFIAIAVYYLFQLKVKLKIKDTGLTIKYFSWRQHSQKIRWKEVEDFVVIRNSIASKWSGWFVNYNHSTRDYSLNKSDGILLILKNGAQIFIGTNHPKKFKQAIKSAMAA